VVLLGSLTSENRAMSDGDHRTGPSGALDRSDVGSINARSACGCSRSGGGAPRAPTRYRQDRTERMACQVETRNGPIILDSLFEDELNPLFEDQPAPTWGTSDVDALQSPTAAERSPSPMNRTRRRRPSRGRRQQPAVPIAMQIDSASRAISRNGIQDGCPRRQVVEPDVFSSSSRRSCAVAFRR
jgi:hypothetical protein